MAREGLVNLTVSLEAKDELDRLSAQATGLAGRRVTLSEALRAAMRVASEHPDELQAACS